MSPIEEGKPRRLVRLPPDQFNASQLLGSFLERFDTEGVILSCFQQQRVYHYGQWTTIDGQGFVFERARSFAAHTLDANTFSAAWYAPTPDLALPRPVEPTGPAFDVSQLQDDKVLLHVMRRVQCRGALLSYQGDDFTVWGFWRWQDKPGEQWARAAWKNPRHGCPGWPESSLGPGNFCPATYERTIQDASAHHRQVTAELAAQHGWSADYSITCNSLPME
jgi:hypothetical protein